MWRTPLCRCRSRAQGTALSPPRRTVSGMTGTHRRAGSTGDTSHIDATPRPAATPQEPYNTPEPQQGEQQPPELLQLPAAQLLTTLRKTWEGAAPGLPSLTAHTLRIVLDDETTTARFVAVCQQFDSPELAGEQRQRFATAFWGVTLHSAHRPGASSAYVYWQVNWHAVLERIASDWNTYYLTCRGQVGMQPRCPEQNQEEVCLILGTRKTEHRWRSAGGPYKFRLGRKSPHKERWERIPLLSNGVLLHTQTGSQESVVLSSCKAGYMAMTRSASDFFPRTALGWRAGWNFDALHRAQGHFRHRQDVGRVRLISCGILWL